MLKHNYPKDALARMRLSLIGKERWRGKYAGWQVSPLLPPDWLYRDTSSNGKVTHFLNSEGEELKTQREAREQIEREPRYSSHQLEFFEVFMVTKQRRMTSKGYTWAASSTLPQGWKVRRTTGKHERLLSPEGEEVRSRRAEIQLLFSTNAPPEKLAEMIASLKHEGWESSEDLPVGWRFKRVYDHQTIFVTSSGKELSSIIEAREKIMTNEEFSEEDLCRLDSFLQNITAVRKIENSSKPLEGWQVEESISVRWKSKLGENSRYGNRYYLAPDGEIFPNRLKVLQHMLAKEFPQEEVHAVMAQMKKWEGWEKNVLLPDNWMVKQATLLDSTKTRVSTRTLRILSSKGVLHKSIKSVLDFLQRSETHNSTDVQRARLLKKRLNQENDRLEPDWKSIHWLPEGWTFKSDGTRNDFCAPDGKILQSRRASLQILLQNGDLKDADKMLESLVLEGWKSDGLLPKGWRFKKTGENEIAFCTRDGARVDGIKNARDHTARIGANEESKDLQNLDFFWEIESQKKKGRKKIKWTKGDETVPSGWMIRPGGKIRSPNGLNFINRLISEEKNYEFDINLFPGEQHCSTSSERRRAARRNWRICRRRWRTRGGGQMPTCPGVGCS